MKTLTKKALAVCSLCLLAVSFNGCQKSEAHATGKKTPLDSSSVKVVVSQVKEVPFEDWGSYSADLRGIEDANLVAPAQGGRVDMLKEIGSPVKAGESLCNIDSARYDAALQAANAQVDVARGDLERAKANVEKGSLGRSVIDGANLAYQNALMMQATAQRANEDCHCQAPFDGVLVSRYIDKYQTVAPGMPTVRISRIDHLEADIALPETEAFGYADGMKAQFCLLQDTSRIYNGRLKSLDRAVDPKSRTVTARIIVDNADGSLKPGMVGRARILRKTYANAIVIPSVALVRLQNGISAMVVDNGTAHQRTVKIGAATDDSTLVTTGLSKGDLLIVSGAFQVSEGTKVRY